MIGPNTPTIAAQPPPKRASPQEYRPVSNSTPAPKTATTTKASTNETAVFTLSPFIGHRFSDTRLHILIYQCFSTLFFKSDRRSSRPRAAFADLPSQLRPKASAIELARIAEPPQQKRNLFRKPPPWRGLRSGNLETNRVFGPLVHSSIKLPSDKFADYTNGTLTTSARNSRSRMMTAITLPGLANSAET